MKVSFICLALTLLFYSCGQHANENIIQVFQPAFTLKPVTTKASGVGSGFCSSSILLNSDSTFTFEHGCEGNSNIVIGRWIKVGDSVELTPYSKRDRIISYNVSFSKSNQNQTATFIILDKTTKPVENFRISFFNYVNSERNYSNASATDSTGTVRFNKVKVDSLEFPKLYDLTGKKFIISAKNLPDTITLFININAIALAGQYNVSYIKNASPVKFKYNNDGKALFDTTHSR